MRALQAVVRLAAARQAPAWGRDAAAAAAAAAAVPQCSRHFAAAAAPEAEGGEGDGSPTPLPFDAATASAPVSVHQLIGDPRTGIADDTTTAPWGDDMSVEWVWSSPSNGVNWFRYSQAGPDQLPHMYMDSRLSDHSKNLMYLLRCKDPDRWTIPALADKFRVRRQRVMAILALKEVQAQQIEQGKAMRGALQPYVFRVPLQDFHLQPDGQPVDLAQLVEAQQEQQQQQQAAGAAAADPLGGLGEFLAPEGSGDGGATVDGQQQQQPDALSSLWAAAGGQAADLAVLMPQVALVAQQLQLQLLQLLQQHNYSAEELERRLLAQVDAAEAYYAAHVAGTLLEQLLAPQTPAGKAAAAGEAAGGGGEGEAAGAAAAPPARPPWLNFERHRQHIREAVRQLSPLLAGAGAEADREAGRLLAALRHALRQPGTDAEVRPLVEAAAPAVLAAAFNRLDLAHRQQLLQLAPDARARLNVSGTDLRAALSGGGAAADGADGADGDAGSAAAAAAAPALWPGQVGPLVDAWGYEDLPQDALDGVQRQAGRLRRLLRQLEDAVPGGGQQQQQGALGPEDLAAVRQATQVYSGLVWEYDRVLDEQAAAASGSRSREPAPLPPTAQRRLMRILRELDANALEKLLLWESYRKELSAAAEVGGRDRRDRRWANRVKRRVLAACKQLDAQAAAQGLPGGFDGYPDLPAATRDEDRVERDLAAAHLDAVVVGRQFHRGSGDRHFKRLDSAPAFEGYSLKEFDGIQEGELSTLTRLAAEREDNMMWSEFRERLLLNIGLTAPGLHQHLDHARPPRPQGGWSWVVHPMGGAARAQRRRELRHLSRTQWLGDGDGGGGKAPQQQPGGVIPLDPARHAAPAHPYVASPGGHLRTLNEEEAAVVGASRARPRRRWYARAK